MGYLLVPRNKSIEAFEFGAFSFPILLEACGYLFASIHNRGRWYRVLGTDPRYQCPTYPELLAMDGFPVTADEARVMARMARNLVAVQRSLPEPERNEHGQRKMPEPHEWPVWMRRDFVDKFAAFAPWADQSRGFRIR